MLKNFYEATSEKLGENIYVCQKEEIQYDNERLP